MEDTPEVCTICGKLTPAEYAYHWENHHPELFYCGDCLCKLFGLTEEVEDD
jgi:hypothetical protein